MLLYCLHQQKRLKPNLSLKREIESKNRSQEAKSWRHQRLNKHHARSKNRSQEAKSRRHQRHDARKCKNQLGFVCPSLKTRNASTHIADSPTVIPSLRNASSRTTATKSLCSKLTKMELLNCATKTAPRALSNTRKSRSTLI